MRNDYRSLRETADAIILARPVQDVRLSALSQVAAHRQERKCRTSLLKKSAFSLWPKTMSLSRKVLVANGRYLAKFKTALKNF